MTAEPMLAAIRIAKEKLDSVIAEGPLYPNVTPQEIRSYLSSRYDFQNPGHLDEIGADVERMMRTWHVQITHPRYMSFQSKCDARVRGSGHPGGDAQPAVG